MPFNIDKATAIHNGKYDYSKVVYDGVYVKVEIVCPVHGSFWQTPKNHIYAKCGCKDCANDRIAGSFDIKTANRKHGHKYDYSKVVYKNVDTKVEIICPIHGSFHATPYKHVNDGTGCPDCKITKMTDATRSTVEEFIAKARSVHGDRYDYSKVVYKNAMTKVEIVCPDHGSFWQAPCNHVSGKNTCPRCSTNVSRSGDAWMDKVSSPSTIREHVMVIEGRRYKVDGYDPDTNTIYEYFGVFWHGCPSYCDHTKDNPRNKTPYKVLYEKTLERIATFERAGFNLVYEWGL